MTQHFPENGRGGPPHWPHATQPASGSNKLVDLSKGGLGLGMVATIAWGLFMAGQTWGTWQERGASMQTQLAELKGDVKEIKNELVALRPILKQIAERPAPQWSMAVRPSK